MRWMTERMAASAGMDIPVFPGPGHHQDPQDPGAIQDLNLRILNENETKDDDGVLEAKIGLNSNKNKAQLACKYTLKEGQKGGHRGGAHSGGGGGSMDRNHHVPRNVGQSKFTMSFGITFGSFFLLIFAF
ncbi:hypothetical protein E3N88_21263 [Mikania micrantha]|uniref:Uncharacterized protein n=1 Tax=Mikania micrantha TaxID=192012 RepID=A0A5N6NKY7_9ASTR|nr:hypothetical protein E3N88_21263 [Mikania micrantha]